MQIDESKKKKRIEEERDETGRAFSYPLGVFDEDIKKIVREERFAYTVATSPRTSNLNSDLYELGRIDVEEEPFYKFAFDATGIISRRHY